MLSPLPRRSMRPASALVALAAMLFAAMPVALAQSTPGAVPAGTRLRFHLATPVSSSGSKTGDTFAFSLLDPIVVGDRVVVAIGAMGSGTLFLAGHAGPLGHEGDLTLRLDWIRTVDDRTLLFDDQRFEVNGRNRKIQSAVLGFVPYVGIGAHFIRGSESHVDENTPVVTVLLRAATISSASPAAATTASASPPAVTLPSPSPTP